jgi:putative tryptophan/tyrosine transport system substrate-binding protein
MRRREFIAGLGSAAAWSHVARAQQPRMPVIGYLSARSLDSDQPMLRALRQGLGEVGYVEGQNLVIESRFADAQFDRLPALVTELVLARAAFILFATARGTIDDPAWRQLRTSNIPVVFNTGTDPVPGGVVSRLNRPGGNFTGIYNMQGEVAAKTLGLLHELVPNAQAIAILADAAGLDAVAMKDVRVAAATVGLRLNILSARTQDEIDGAFASLDQQRPDALFVMTNARFVTWARQIAALAARHRAPAIYARREFAVAGGLLSYGYNTADGYRQLGHYVGRILKGEKAGDLPVFQPTKFELVINLKTAKAMGFEIPARLLALADEVIE